MNEKPEALRLADDFDRAAKRELFRYLDLDKAAAELRRQHAEIERLRADNEALRRDAELGRWIREETPPIEEIAARVDAMEDKT